MISSESWPIPRSLTRISRLSSRQSRLLWPCFFSPFSFFFFFFFLCDPFDWASDASEDRGDRSHRAGRSSSTKTEGSEKIKREYYSHWFEKEDWKGPEGETNSSPAEQKSYQVLYKLSFQYIRSYIQEMCHRRTMYGFLKKTFNDRFFREPFFVSDMWVLQTFEGMWRFIKPFKGSSYAQISSSTWFFKGPKLALHCFSNSRYRLAWTPLDAFWYLIPLLIFHCS